MAQKPKAKGIVTVTQARHGGGRRTKLLPSGAPFISLGLSHVDFDAIKHLLSDKPLAPTRRKPSK